MADGGEWIVSRMNELEQWFAENPDLVFWPFDEKSRSSPHEFPIHFMLQCHARGEDVAEMKERCLIGAHKILEILSHNKKTLVKVSPESYSQQDFVTHPKITTGFVRFAVFDEEGETTFSEVSHAPANFFEGV